MYNIKRKILYMSWSHFDKQKIKVVTNLFDKLAPYEEAAGLDFYELSMVQKIEAYGNIGSIMYNQNSGERSILKKYLAWNDDIYHTDTARSFSKADFDYSKSVRQSYFSTSLHLQRSLNVLFDPEDENTTDLIPRAFYWLILSGIQTKYAKEIRCSDVKENGHLVKVNGKDFQINPLGVDSIRRCAELQSFKFKHPLYTKDWQRVQDDRLLRSVKGQLDLSAIDKLVAARNDRNSQNNIEPISLSTPYIYISGLMIRAREQSILIPGGELSVFYEDFINRVCDFDEKSKNNNHRKYTSYLNAIGFTYKHWTTAFFK